MKVCCYDNPDTMRRELWQDGQLIGFYSAEAMLQKGAWPPPAHKLHTGANAGPWAPGQLVGDREAIKTSDG